MKLSFLIALSFIIQISFGQNKKQVLYPPQVLSMSYPDFVNSCDLTSSSKKQVYTRFLYSGMEEYWGLSTEKKFSNSTQINAFLNIPDHIKIRKEHLELLKEVHNNYWKKYLIIDAVGTFDKGKYGHLGSNNSIFTVSKIIDVYIVDKKLN